MTKLSNDWSQAVLKLNEQSALAFTLQTQLRLVQEEHHKTTNQLPQILSNLSTATASNVALTESSRLISNRLQLQVLELKDQYEDATQHVANASDARKEAETKARQALNEASNAWTRWMQISNQLQETRVKIAALEAGMNDPLTLRRQLETIQSGTARSSVTQTSAMAGPGKIQLNASGFVEASP